MRVDLNPSARRAQSDDIRVYIPIDNILPCFHRSPVRSSDHRGIGIVDKKKDYIENYRENQ